jgi:replicative DNA helicase
MTDRVPPYDQEAERAVLGAILLNNSALAHAMPIVSPEHFYLENLRTVYKAMIELAEANSAIDAVTLGNFLKANGQLERVGGATIMGQLTDSVATVANVEHYARIVRSLYAVRAMIYATMEATARGFVTGTEGVETYLAEVRQAVTLAAAELRIGSGPQHIDATLMHLYDEMERAALPQGIVKTGIPIIDETTGGLWPGLLHIVAARPAMGKTAFMLNIATNAALAGHRVLFVSLEDVMEYLVARMVARFADIDLNDIMLRRPQGAEEWKRLMDAGNKLSGKKPLWFEDSGGLTSAAVHQIAAAHQQMHGLDLIVADHLGEVADTGENDTSIATNAARTFRNMAKELNVPVVLGCQLNRNVENRPDKRPRMSDLRQSGAIEAVARVVWFLYRPGYYEPDGDERRDLQLIVGKANHGKTGMLRLWIELSRMWVRQWEYEDGPFPGFDRQPQEARDEGQERKKGRRQGSFFGGADAHDQWDKGGVDDY